jgi:CheY-like chemotaxis protein
VVFLGSLSLGLQIKTMTGLITQRDRFSFSEGQLLSGLPNYEQVGGTGYWQHHFDRMADRGKEFVWYLGIHQGKLIYSSSSSLSAYGLLKILLRYAPQAQRHAAKPQWRLLQQKAQRREISELELWQYLQQEKLLPIEDIDRAIKLKILSDLDSYVTLGGGWAEFIPVPSLGQKILSSGHSAADILALSTQRRQLWKQLTQDVPSLKLIPRLGSGGWEKTSFNQSQRDKVESLIQKQISLNQIAQNMAKDSLEIAQMFAKLVRAGAVELKAPPSSRQIILTVDDSPIILNQFDRWLTNLGYDCVPCQHATQAIKSINQYNPVAIFLDINMPVISGFDLVKKIRSQPEFASIPIVILTGEQKLSNKWRAQWSGCEFLNKPTSSQESKGFQGVLQELIPRILKNAAATGAEISPK